VKNILESSYDFSLLDFEQPRLLAAHEAEAEYQRE